VVECRGVLGLDFLSQFIAVADFMALERKNCPVPSSGGVGWWREICHFKLPMAQGANKMKNMFRVVAVAAFAALDIFS